ncbi:hypothetical protein KDA_52420 [Dictyobacter alpinus]|uniref:Aminoglycoside phosphotransferase domain-containing protein n=1 Tax=Dictyobacter alpinus TaxID=2014873 RepID=A0A402BED4_9CHLR|nr:phosphotransferase [Dictyobacter alpinus]GCE29758.1 hypothetical protein KDA_52420 [Dictyobacter alpinus]
MSEVSMPDDLQATIVQRYGLVLKHPRRIEHGDESVIWQALTQRGPIIIRLSPAWRSPERLTWIHQIMYGLHKTIPQVVIPLQARDGRTLFYYENQSVALFPYIAGTQFDRENPMLRHQAATFLARLHLALLRNTPDTLPFERDLLIGPPPLPTHSDSQALVDYELDRWNETLLQISPSLTKGLIHGDYYRRNLLAQGERLIALLDWDTLHCDFLMQEVAWSSWEFCKVLTGDNWHPDRVKAFVQSYREAGGPCPREEYVHFIPFIRWRLRKELRDHEMAIAQGLPGEPEYAARLLCAFERLRTIPIQLF